MKNSNTFSQLTSVHGISTAVPEGESPYLYGVHQPGGEMPGNTQPWMWEATADGGRGKGWIVFTEVMIPSDTPARKPGDANPASGIDISTIAYSPNGRDQEQNRDFTEWSSLGYGVIVRLNFGYNRWGTLPYSNDYDKFATWCGDYVKNSHGAHIWIIANEMNHASEWPSYYLEKNPHDENKERPRVEPITAARYKEAYLKCRSKIRTGAHANDLVLMGGIGPWNIGHRKDLDARFAVTISPGVKQDQGYRFGEDKENTRDVDKLFLGDWVEYHKAIIESIDAGNLDGFAIHTYSRRRAVRKVNGVQNPPCTVEVKGEIVYKADGFPEEEADAYVPCSVNGEIKLRTGAEKQIPVYDFMDSPTPAELAAGIPDCTHRHNGFRTFTDFLGVHPPWAKKLPVYITETNKNGQWESTDSHDKESYWVREVYKHINEWNRNPENQLIRAVCLYRWWPGDEGPWHFGNKEKIKADFRAALTENYRWDTAFAHPSFYKRWQQSDLPVLNETVPQRPLLWGVNPISGGLEEPYGTANQTRLVQYFEKARMEINNPSAPEGPYFVTSGLLVREMVIGRMQTSDNTDVEYLEPTKPIAADDSANNLITYEKFKNRTARGADRRTQNSAVIQQIDSNGNVTDNNAKFGNYQLSYSGGEYRTETGHNIPGKTYQFLTDPNGMVDKMAKAIDPSWNWINVMGLPITDAYWASIPLRGVTTDVLIQPFERRVLTYTPSNDDANKIQMGNAGAHYFQWRYKTLTPVAWKAANVKSQSIPTTLALNEQKTVNVRVQNVGTQPWAASGTAGSTAAAPASTERGMIAAQESETSPETQATSQSAYREPVRLIPVDAEMGQKWGITSIPLASSVLQGGIAEFNVPITAPNTEGLHNLQLRLAGGDAEWAGRYQTVNVAVKVGSPVENTYDGFIDVGNCAIIWGWAWDSHRPNYIVDVDLYYINSGDITETEYPITTVRADQYREDLLRAGNGNGKHGFSFVPPDSMFDLTKHVIYGRIVGPNRGLGISGTRPSMRGRMTNYSGRVTEPLPGDPHDPNTHRPIAGATVTLSSNYGSPRTVQTDAQGNYSFGPVRAGIGIHYLLSVSKQFYEFITPNRIIEDINTFGVDGERKEWFDGHLQSFTIFGKVLTSDEQTPLPIPNIAIKLNNTGQTTNTSAAPDASKGTYRFENIVACHAYEVEPSDQYYSFSPTRIPIANLTGNTEVSFQAARIRQKLTVILKDQWGQPVRDATVILTGFRETGTRLPSTSESDPSKYVFEGLRKGRAYTVAFSKTHYDFNPSSYNTGDVLADVEYQPTVKRHLYTVSGSITSQSIGPNIATPISVKHTDNDPSFVDVTINASNLEFSLTDLHGGGSYIITPVEPWFDFVPDSQTITNLSENKTGAKKLPPFTATRKTAPIQGYVRDVLGRGLVGVLVKATINAHPGKGTAWEGLTSANGYYSLQVPAGLNYTVSVAREGCSFSSAQTTIVNLQTAGAQADFVGGFDIHGHVEDALGRGIANVELSLTPAIKATTNSNGEYTFKYLSPGTGYSLTPVKGDMKFVPETAGITNLLANTEAPLLKGGYKISGRLTDEAGTFLQNVQVTVTGATNPPSVMVDPYAFYIIEGLVPGGNYVVTAARADYVCEPPKAVSNLSKNETVNFKAGYGISGLVADLGNNPMAGVTLKLFAGEQLRGTLLTDAEGKYAFNYFTMGNFKVTATKVGTNIKFLPAAYEPGWLTANQTANFTEAFMVRGTVRDNAGAAISNVELRLTGEQTATTSTDAAGRFEFALWSRKGDYTVTPVKEMYLFTPAQKSLPNLAGAEAVDFTGQQLRRIGGTVKSGRFWVRGIEIQLTESTSGVQRGSTLPGRPSQVTQTDSAGKYQFIILPRKGNSYIIRPVSDGHVFAPGSSTLPAADADQVNVNFECDPQPPDDGRVKPL